MKNILTIFIFSLFIYTKASGQINKPHYDTCAALQQFQGEWRYTNGADTIRIYLRYYRGKSINRNSIIDNLIGFYEYKHGNNIVSGNYANRFYQFPYMKDNVTYDNMKIFLRYSHFGNLPYSQNELFGGLFYELNGTQFYKLKAVINYTGTQMTLFLTYQNTMTENNQPWNPPTGSSKMPDSFVLIKQP
ncbi:DUF6705 family protein [Ferruginibacter yonginensis]|uniref:DUF6705 family protein n=1 Tax=Ferruginibacter yonginensis TaxID=1310416 RepID=A0ABV8QTE2_9BACT